MRAFDYIKEPEKLLTPEIVQMIGKIHEHKGKQELFLEANIDVFIQQIRDWKNWSAKRQNQETDLSRKSQVTER